MQWGNWLDALEAGLEKHGSCLPSLCRRVGTVALLALFITKRMGGIGVGPDLDALVILSRSGTQPIHILSRHPLILPGLVIEQGRVQLFDRSFGLHHSSVIGDRCSEAFPLAGKPERVRSTHAVADDAVNVLLDMVARIEKLTAGVDVLQDERLV